MEEKLAQVPYIVYEGSLARIERIIKKLVLALIITIILLFASNCVWLYAWMQYDYSSDATTTETSTVTVDGKDGIANYIGNDGEIKNGTDNGKENTSDKKSPYKGK